MAAVSVILPCVKKIHSPVYYKIGVLLYFTKLTSKHLRRSPFMVKLQTTEMLKQPKYL